MTQTNAALRSSFENGAETGENHTGSMHIETLPNGHTALVGYGWALYAERDDSGHITVYDGWHNWAQKQGEGEAEATPRHIRNLESLADSHSSNNPQTASAPDSVREIGRMGLEAPNGLTR